MVDRIDQIRIKSRENVVDSWWKDKKQGSNNCYEDEVNKKKEKEEEEEVEGGEKWDRSGGVI